MKLRALVSMARAVGPLSPQETFEEDDAAEAGRFIEAGYAEPVEDDDAPVAGARKTAVDQRAASRKKRTKT